MDTTFPKSHPDLHQNKKHHNNALTYVIFFIAAGCFLASLFFPVFLVQAQDIDGYWVLFLGWLGFLFFQFAWYAAPLMLVAIYTSAQSPRFALLLAIVAVVVASEAFLFTEIPLRESQQQIFGFGLGFYLWYVSFYIAALGVLQKIFLSRMINKTPVFDIIDIVEKQQVLEQQSLQSNVEEIKPDVIPVQPKTGVTKKVIITSSEPASRIMPPPLPIKTYRRTPPPLPRSRLKHKKSRLSD